MESDEMRLERLARENKILINALEEISELMSSGPIASEIADKALAQIAR